METSDLYGGWSYGGDPRAPWNQPDPPDWPECAELPDRGEFLCPSCEWKNECEEARGVDE